jgi:hypothetical protein
MVGQVRTKDDNVWLDLKGGKIGVENKELSLVSALMRTLLQRLSRRGLRLVSITFLISSHSWSACRCFLYFADHLFEQFPLLQERKQGNIGQKRDVNRKGWKQ